MSQAKFRLMFYVQHLLGIGHLVRASRIAKALADASFEVVVVVGGEMPGPLDFGRASVVSLPPVKAGTGGFGELVSPAGTPFGTAEKAERRDRLLALFASFVPDVLLIEAFPFGRRPMRFELMPLLEAATALPRRPLVVTSVRDILQENRKPERDRETVDLVRRFFDLVVVHGDAGLLRFEASFPAAAAIADKLAYSGLVGPDIGEGEAGEAFDVIVSVGGGAVGAALLEAAVAARPRTHLRDARWLVLAGPNLPEGARPAAGEGLVVRTFEPDLPARLRRARLSVSQAGYNTVADVLSARGCRCVLVPFAEGGETEQSRRAEALEASGLAVVVERSRLDAVTLAAAIDHALDCPPPSAMFQFDGARRTAEMIERAALARA